MRSILNGVTDTEDGSPGGVSKQPRLAHEHDGSSDDDWEAAPDLPQEDEVTCYLQLAKTTPIEGLYGFWKKEVMNCATSQLHNNYESLKHNVGAIGTKQYFVLNFSLEMIM